MEKIQNYTNISIIEETQSSIIYRARREKDKKSYIIKELKSDNPTPSEVARFKQEYEIIQSLDIKGIIKTYEIIEYEKKIALVLEDFNGISLKEIVNNKKLSLDLFFEIAIKISRALGHLHKENIIHRDIKPKNILFNEKTNQLKITDFGISNEITGQTFEISSPNIIEGTLQYMSPEQTGRINRQLDYRSDIYSLGITFYELLSGSVPFNLHDPIEIIHHHIAIMHTPLINLNSDIPGVLSKIVDKLLSKMPEERYQNCFCLMNDLERCYKEIKTNGKIENFELAQNDISPFFTVPQLLVGRENELDILSDSINRVCSTGNRSEIMLVSGNPGIGKSALINETYKSILSKKGYFLSGKYDQFRKDVPYSAIIQAFIKLVDQILIQQETIIADWRNKLLNVLGPNGKVITDVIPEVALIIGKQPDVPELGPEQNQNRFNYVFRNFISVIASEDHPLVLFLDDLQWIDLASLYLMTTLISDIEINYFLIIGSYRDNEVSDLHPLMMTLNELKQKNIPINSIHLDALNVGEVNIIISNFISCHAEESLPLAKVVHNKTNGNPFFVNQFMKNLHEENLLNLNQVSGWDWEINIIKKKHVTENVLQLITEKIKKLPSETLEIVKVCACIGNRFNLEIISKIINKTIEYTLRKLTPALAGDIFQISTSGYKFAHDRIQEAAYSLVNEIEKQKLHNKIGYLMLESSKDEDLKKSLLYIVDQLNKGRNLIVSEEERFKIAKLNLQAGKKAKASTAYKSALNYLKTGIDLITFSGVEGKNCWDKKYKLTLSLYSNCAEAAYLNCEYEEMEHLSTIVLKNTTSLLDSIRVYEIKIHAFMAQNKLQEALDVGLKALKILNIKFPNKPGNFHIMMGLLTTLFLLRNKDPNDLLEQKIMNDPRANSVTRLLSAIVSIAYWTDPNLLPLIIFKLIKISIKQGNNNESPYFYCAYGFILCSIGKINSGYEYGKLGLGLIEKLKATKQFSRTHFVMNTFVRHWKEYIEDCIEPLRIAYQKGLEVGDLEFTAHSIMMYEAWKFYSGHEINQLIDEIEKVRSIVKNIKQATQLQMINMDRQTLENLSTNTGKPWELKGSFYNEFEMIAIHDEAKDLSSIANVYFNKLLVSYLMGEFTLSLEYIQIIKKYSDAFLGLYQYTLFYFLDSLTSLALYDSCKWFQKKQVLRKINKNIKQIKKWVKHNPSNQSNKLYLIQAELMRIKGKKSAAINFYHKSIESAKQNKFIHEEAIANELAAKFWIEDKNERNARDHMQSAYNCYKKWGALTKTIQLENKYNKLLK